MALPSSTMDCDSNYLSDSDLSSRLSSPASETPSPPPELRAAMAYPSPPRSQESSQVGSPVPDGMDSRSASNSDRDGPPPAKRRRISERKPRTTEYLDLRRDRIELTQQPQLDALLQVLHKSKKIVVVAGAGISVSAGIPDFRSSTGLFTTLRAQHNLKGSGKDLFDASVYKDDSSTASFHDMVREMAKQTKSASPTLFHHMLATLAQDDRLLRLYSQNVDGIDTALEPLKTHIPLKKNEDGKWPRTIQLHGSLDKMVCSKCQQVSDFEPNLFEGALPPVCPKCEEVDHLRTSIAGKRSHGIGRLRPRMVLYNEHNPDDEAIGAVTRDDLRKRPDAIIVVGTSMKIPGVRRIVREMCATVRDRRDGVSIWINNDPPPVGKDFEDCWDIVVKGPSDAVATLAALRKWDEKVEVEEPTEMSVERAKSTKVQVIVPRPWSFKNPSPLTTPQKVPPTPIASPLTISRGFAVLPSIEDSFTENEDLLDPPTPSKPQKTIQRMTTAKTKALSALDQLQGKKSEKAGAKAKAAPKKAHSSVRMVKKATNVKMVKAATTKAAAKVSATGRKAPASKKQGLINQALKQTKSVSLAAKAAKDGKPLKSPAKNNRIAADPMQPVSPNSRKTSFGDVIKVGQDAEDAIKVRESIEVMKVANVLN